MSRSDKWAIVTGASSGIGKALAFEFAGGGFNLVLVGRNRDALAEVAEQCSRRGVETEVLVADLARNSSVESLIAALHAVPRRYEVLVNNAGFGLHGDFASSNIEQNID